MALDSAKGEVILYVTSMGASVDFWARRMGLALISPLPASGSWDQEHWVELDAGSFNLCLHSGGAFSAETHCSFSLRVISLEGSLKALDEHGVPHSGVLTPHPGVIFAEVRDPDGHLFFVKPA